MQPNPDIPGGLYIHIPFCERKCLYCDFYSVADLGKSGAFVAALEQEMELAGQTELEFDTIYVGGGTPSVLEATAVGQIIDAAFKHFNVQAGAEVTIEVNPGTVAAKDLRSYRRTGINRLNIGVQSFHDAGLKFLGRIHSSDEAVACIDRARQAGFENVGLDLIYGLPEQSDTLWRADLEQAVQIEPEHISCYMLTRESGTPLDMEVQAGRIQLTGDDTLRVLFETTVEYLTANGFLHYEVSNFARRTGDGSSPWQSRHNWKYWAFAPYIGLGPSAHSYLAPVRCWNHRSLDRYLKDIRRGRLPLAGKEHLTREQMIMEAIYLGFRTVPGIDLDAFQHRFGIDFLEIFHETIAEFEMDELLKVSGNHCGLTIKGMVLLDAVTAEFTSQEFS